MADACPSGKRASPTLSPHPLSRLALPDPRAWPEIPIDSFRRNGVSPPGGLKAVVSEVRTRDYSGDNSRGNPWFRFSSLADSQNSRLGLTLTTDMNEKIRLCSERVQTPVAHHRRRRRVSLGRIVAPCFVAFAFLAMAGFGCWCYDCATLEARATRGG